MADFDIEKSKEFVGRMASSTASAAIGVFPLILMGTVAVIAIKRTIVGIIGLTE
tara:strand:+ start:136 stop:297 length:162 start_codon:yes stop_codon:yes gene_type:complete